MHPLGLYLGITDIQREHMATADADRRVSGTLPEATPIALAERASRMARLGAILRRRIIRTAGA